MCALYSIQEHIQRSCTLQKQKIVFCSPSTLVEAVSTRCVFRVQNISGPEKPAFRLSSSKVFSDSCEMRRRAHWEKRKRAAPPSLPNEWIDPTKATMCFFFATQVIFPKCLTWEPCSALKGSQDDKHHFRGFPISKPSEKGKTRPKW